MMIKSIFLALILAIFAHANRTKDLDHPIVVLFPTALPESAALHASPETEPSLTITPTKTPTPSRVFKRRIIETLQNDTRRAAIRRNTIPCGRTPEPSENGGIVPTATADVPVEASAEPWSDIISISPTAESIAEAPKLGPLDKVAPSSTPFVVATEAPIGQESSAPVLFASSTPVSVEDLLSTHPLPDSFFVPEYPPRSVTPRPSHSPIPSKTDEPKQAACFPADATVTLSNGNSKRMDEVEIGDEVQVGSGAVSKIFMFTHRVSGVQTKFVRLALKSGVELDLTGGHYLHISGELKAARSARIGDSVILANGTRDSIAHVSSTWKNGLYNPQTLHGNIVVSGVLASTYTEAISPQVAHALLAPLRVIYLFLGGAMRSFEAKGHCLATLLPRGPAVL